MSYSPQAKSALSGLSGDVTATGPGTVASTVNKIGGKLASDVANATAVIDAATTSPTPNTIVARDNSGTIQGNVIGNITGNVVGNVQGSVVGNLTGNVTGNVTGLASQNLPLAGGTMTGAIYMGNQTITQVATAANDTDAVNLAQLKSVSIINAIIFG